MKKSILSLLIVICGTGSALAESFEQHFGVGPGGLNAANVQQITGYATMQGALNAYLCSEDMRRREKEVEADHEAYNKHLQEWLQKSKDQVAAENLAKAEAAQKEIDERRSSKHTWVTVYGPNGNTSVRYDGLGTATDRIDHSVGFNRDETTYTNLGK